MTSLLDRATVAPSLPPTLPLVLPRRPLDDAPAPDRDTPSAGAERDRAELERFESLRHRRLDVPRDPVSRTVAGASVVVTGGTGCVGSRMIRQLAEHGAARITSISRRPPQQWPFHRDVEYALADVADPDAVGAVLRRAAPDLVVNCAGLRSPAEAETRPVDAWSTNVLGALTVFDAAVRADCPLVLHASTGKAVRLRSSGVYASSKKVAEALLVERLRHRPDVRLGLARFTHVVDNSLIMQRLQRWSVEGSVTLHDANIAFYGQSATEAAQLLLAAAIEATPDRATTAAIRDLEWPFELIALTRAVLRRNHSRVPIRVTGYRPGYDEAVYPMLHDPRLAGSLSPLVDLLEGRRLLSAGATPDADVFRTAPASRALPDAFPTADPVQARRRLAAFSEAVVDRTVQDAPAAALERVLEIGARALPTMEPRARDLYARFARRSAA